jgi:hypothetical protein
MTRPAKRNLSTACLLATILMLTMTQANTPTSAQAPRVKVVYAGHLIDAVNDRVRTNVSVVIEDGRIRTPHPPRRLHHRSRCGRTRLRRREPA